MLDGGFARVEDSGEVEGLVGFNDEFEMPGGFRQNDFAVREVGREECSEMFEEVHGT